MKYEVHVGINSKKVNDYVIISMIGGARGLSASKTPIKSLFTTSPLLRKANAGLPFGGSDLTE